MTLSTSFLVHAEQARTNKNTNASPLCTPGPHLFKGKLHKMLLLWGPVLLLSCVLLLLLLLLSLLLLHVIYGLLQLAATVQSAGHHC